jgi:hypothetical protein
MSRLHRTGKGSKARRAGSAVLAALLPLVLLAGGLAGCQHNRATKGEPLFGDVGPEPGKPPPPAPSSTKTHMVPAIPSSNSSTSPAALAVEPLNGGRPPLRIEDPRAQPDPAAATNDWRAVGGPSPGGPTVIAIDPAAGVQTASGTVLHRPEPLVSPLNTQPGVPGPAQSPQPSLDQLQDQLKARNVLWQRLEQNAGGVRFLCAVPNPQSADIQRVYEATAPDAQTAIRAVLNQIDQQR